MAIVKVNHMANMKKRKTTARTPSNANARSIVMFHRTSDSWACASERAHRRRYDAVLEMQPRQNSIVSVWRRGPSTEVSEADPESSRAQMASRRTDDLVNDDLAHVVTLLLGLLSHRDRMSLVSRPVLGVRLVVGRGERGAAVPVLPDYAVALLLDALRLAVFEVRARAEHPGDADEGEQEEDDLDEGLAAVELLLGFDLCHTALGSVRYSDTSMEESRARSRARGTS